MPVRFLRLAVVASVLGTTLLSALPAQAATPPPYGPDVSSWQHPNGVAIDWAKVRGGGSSFAIVKATEGSGYTNPYFASDVKAARAAHLVVGGYAYVRPGSPVQSTAVAQAKHLVAAMGSVAATGTLPPILDLEQTGGLSHGDLITWTQVFLETVRAQTGRTPIVYSYPYFWSSSMGSTAALGRYPLWLASYRSTPPAPLPGWSAWTMWQYTSTATVPGIGGSVDLSQFHGTSAQLATLADGTVQTPWAVAAPAAPVAVSGVPRLGAAVVSWLPGDDGGQVPSSYTVTATPGGATVQVPGTTTRATVPGLTGGTAYTFSVTATNSAGTSSPSASSAQVVAGQLPAAPAGLTAAVGAGTVTLSWQASPSGGATSYALLRCSPAPCTPTATVATVPASALTYVDHPVADGSSDTYVVQAVNAFGSSAPTAPVTVTPIGPPPAPTALVAVPGPASVRLTWAPPAGVSGSAVTQYLVTVDGAAPVSLPGSARAFAATALAPTSHTFALQAANGLGASPAVQATAVAAAPPSALALALPRGGAVVGRPMAVTVTARRTDTSAALAGVPVVVTYALRTGAVRTARVVTGPTGAGVVTFPATFAGTVRAVLSATPTLGGARAAVGVNPKPPLTAVLSAASSRAGRSVVLAGATSPLLAGERVVRQGWYGGSWHVWATAVVDRYGHYRFVVTPTVATTNRYRVVMAATVRHATGTSPTVSLVVRP